MPLHHFLLGRQVYQKSIQEGGHGPYVSEHCYAAWAHDRKISMIFPLDHVPTLLRYA